MTHSIFIDGAAGTTGLQIRERLDGRGEFSLTLLDDERRKDQAARAWSKAFSTMKKVVPTPSLLT